MNYCPVHAIYADEESGARTVDTKSASAAACAARRARGTCRASTARPAYPRCISCGRCAEQCPNGAIKFIDWEDIAQKVIDQGVVRTTTLVQA
ncbi:MAG: 4Fe-4S binding protein [Adlercreutzia sp.]